MTEIRTTTGPCATGRVARVVGVATLPREFQFDQLLDRPECRLDGHPEDGDAREPDENGM